MTIIGIWSLCSFCSFTCFGAWENSLKLGAGYEHFHRSSPVADGSGAAGNLELSSQWIYKSWRWSSKAQGIARSGVKDRSKSSIGEIQEFFIEHSNPVLTAQLGINTANWGVTDFNNPLDVVNSKNFDSFLSPLRRGAAMIKIDKALGRWSFEVLLIPKQVPSILPSETSRYLPRESLPGRFVGSIQSELGIVKGFISEDPTTYKQTAPTILDRADQNNVAARIQGGFQETDLQVVYHEGLMSTPQLDVEDYNVGSPIQLNPILYAIGPDLLLKPVYSKYRTVGGGFSTAFGNWLIKGASARSQALFDSLRLRASQSFVSSIETSRSFWGLDCTLLLQNFQIYEESNTTSSLFDTSGFFSLTQALNQSWLVGIRLSQGLEWNIGVGLQLATQSKGGLGRISLEKRLSDHLQLTLASELIDGETGSTLHQLRAASKTFIGLTLSM